MRLCAVLFSTKTISCAYSAENLIRLHTVFAVCSHLRSLLSTPDNYNNCAHYGEILTRLHTVGAVCLALLTITRLWMQNRMKLCTTLIFCDVIIWRFSFISLGIHVQPKYFGICTEKDLKNKKINKTPSTEKIRLRSQYTHNIVYRLPSAVFFSVGFTYIQIMSIDFTKSYFCQNHMRIMISRVTRYRTCK